MIETKNNIIGSIKPKLNIAGKINKTIEYISPNNQEKSIIPTKEIQEVTPDEKYNGLSKVIVDKIPDEYIIPAGEINITENGEVNVADKETAIVNIPEKELGTKTIIKNGTYKASDDNLDGYSEVEVSTSSVSSYKVEKQIYTPVEDESSHTFSHNLGVVPDLIAIYSCGLPTMYQKGNLALFSCISLRDGVFNLENKSRYTKQVCTYSSSNGSVLLTDNNLDTSITSTENMALIRNATNSSFEFHEGNKSDLHLKSGITYYIIIMAGVDV